MTMEKYTIMCTESQTKKALELGAPIIFKCQKVRYLDGGYSYEIVEKDGEPVLETPTAEQMIGWLEEQGGIKHIDIYRNCDYWGYGVITYMTTYDVTKHFSTRKEATLAAIDAALDYLSKSKED